MTKEEKLRNCIFYKGAKNKTWDDIEYTGFDFFYWEAEEKYVHRSEFVEKAVVSYGHFFDDIITEQIDFRLLCCLFAVYTHVVGQTDRNPNSYAEDFTSRFLKQYLEIKKGKPCDEKEELIEK